MKNKGKWYPNKWKSKCVAVKGNVGDCLQALYDKLSNGVKKQVVKDESIKQMFDAYGVKYGE